MERCYYGPFGKAPRHLPFRRAALSFMQWQLQRGVLQPPFSDRPGSPWWRAVNERILRDGCEAVGLSGGLPGPASSRTVDYWMSFADYPVARAWYRAHNGSVVAAYLVRSYLSAEHGFGRLVDFGVIVPRLQQLYEWSAHELAAPGLLDCIHNGAMTYAWSFEDRHVWQPPRSFILQMAAGAPTRTTCPGRRAISGPYGPGTSRATP